MEQQTVSNGPLHLITVCVDSGEHSRMIGRIYHRFSQQPITFLGAEGVLFSIEKLMDEWDYPQSTLKMRSFAPSSPHQSRQPGMARKAINDPLAYTGQDATFVVHVKYRQNATWQGTVTWADKNKQQNFRSALELIKLMDSAMDESLPPEQEQTAEQGAALING